MAKTTKGSSLIVTLLVLSAVLISTLSIALITVRDRKASIGSVNSNRAYQLADEGIEKVMQVITHGNNNYINKTGENNLTDDLNMIDAFCDSATGLIRDNGEGYSVELFDRSDPRVKINCDDSSRPVLDIDIIKSVGYNKNTSRAISAPVSFLEKGLIAYWRLNEDSGEEAAYDWTRGGGENIGQLSDGASFAGDSADIPNDEFIKAEGLLEENKSITLSVWTKIKTLGIRGSDAVSLGNYAGIRIDDKSNGNRTVGFFYQGDNKFKFTSSNTTLTANNEWHMITYTIDSGKKQAIYIDDQQKGNINSFSETINYSGQGEDTYLGKNAYDGGTPINNFNNYNFEGEMREVRVYNRALTADEVSMLYNISKP